MERSMSRFLRSPPTVTNAARVIVFATSLVVVISGALMRFLDPHEFPNIWIGMWWAIQTVTTVGYGDVTPHRVGGRIVAGFIMLEGIAFLAIVTAAVTSTFIARAEEERAREQGRDEQAITHRFDELDARLDQIEALLRSKDGQS
jgi:voltage-gated potassium channel